MTNYNHRKLENDKEMEEIGTLEQTHKEHQAYHLTS